MSDVMLKAVAKMAGITPEEITENINSFRETALKGIEALERIDNRLEAIEKSQEEIKRLIGERPENGKEK